MSYDIMVFDPAVAPRSLSLFREWYEKQSARSEGHSYDDPALTTPALSAWFHEMRATFPAMNGPLAAGLEHVPIDRIGGSSIGRHVIYAGFGWSVAERALELSERLARFHQLGFYDPSSDDGSDSAPLRFPG